MLSFFIVSVVIASREHISTDQDAAAHLRPETLGPALLVEVDQVFAPFGPVAVAAVGIAHTASGLADVAYMTVHYASSFLAHFHMNWLSPVKVRQILIGGDRKMLVYDDMEPTEKVRLYDSGIKVTTQEGIYKMLVDYRTGDMWAPKTDFGEALSAGCAHFVDCVHKGVQPITGAEMGLSVVRLLEAASKSLAAQGQRISV